MAPDSNTDAFDPAAYLLRATKLAAEAANSDACEPAQRIGVVGSGTMGSGIAIACLAAGLDVTLVDSSQAALGRAERIIATELERSAEKGRLTLSKEETLAGFTFASELSALADVDIVIEAVFESLAVKQDVFRQLDRICRPGCLLATNTSTLDIDLIAGVTARPQNVIGLHFFSPANVMPLLEIVHGASTNPDIRTRALQFGKSIRKTSVMVGNCYGFAGNRMAEGFQREANFMLLEGADPTQIDAVMRDFGMAMGPFAVADVVGIDVPHRARQENSQAIAGDRSYYRMADLLVEMQRYGLKSGRGFFRYSEGSRIPQEDPEIMDIAAREAERLAVERRVLDNEEIVDRCILPIVNEGFRVIEEGIAARASDLDVIYAYGYGFPRTLGGPMAYAQQRGFAEVLERIRQFEARYGSGYWAPSNLLIETVRTGTPLVPEVMLGMESSRSD